MVRFVVTLLILALSPNFRAEGAEPKADVVRGNNRFAFDLYGQLGKGPGNLFVSPYSISTALAMTYAGARGETAEQMAKVLHFDGPDEPFHRAFGSLGQALNADGSKRGYRLSVANRLWGQQGY